MITAAPNFAYEWTAQRGLPDPAEGVDLSNVVLIIGSEPVSMDAIRSFDKAFAPFGLPRSAFKPSYGIAEATLFVSTIEPARRADRASTSTANSWGPVQAVRAAPDDPNAVAQVSCGQVARSQWAVIVDADTGEELPDGRVGEIWLHGNNVCRGYWGRPDESRATFGARLQSRLPAGSHADGVAGEGEWLRTGDLGVYLDGELYVTGRIADLVTIDGCQPLSAGHRGHRSGGVADRAAGLRGGFHPDERVERPRDHRRACGGHRPVSIRSPRSRRSARRCRSNMG